MHESLVGFASSITRDEAVARDIVQETFVKLWEGRQRLDPNRSLRSLLFRMVRNLALNHSRDHQNRANLLAEQYVDTQSAPTTPDVELAGTQLKDLMQRLIDQLPDRQREALRMSRFDGLSHDEIAEAMGISPRTVNNHLVKALRHLRQHIAQFAPHLIAEPS